MVTIAPMDPPIIGDDLAVTDEDTAVDIEVLGNDMAADGSALTVQSVTPGANGTTSINGNGSIQYIPGTNFNGDDSFTYTIADAYNGTATATVVVSVNPVNDPPVAVDDTAAASEGAAVDISVLANDTDPDNDALFVQGATPGIYGTVEVTGTGAVTYTPGPLEGSDPVQDTFTYTVSDAYGETDEGTVTVTISRSSAPPSAADDTAETAEDQPVTIDILFNDSDSTGGALTIAGVTQGTHGSVVIVDSAVEYSPEADFFGEDSFTYTIENAQSPIGNRDRHRDGHRGAG